MVRKRLTLSMLQRQLVTQKRDIKALKRKVRELSSRLEVKTVEVIGFQMERPPEDDD